MPHTRKRKPVFSIGVETNTYSGGDFRDAMFALKVTLPWFNRSVYDADIARAESLRDATRSDLEATKRELYTQLTRLITEAQNNRQIVSAYAREVLPKSEKAVETLQSAWVSSKATLLEVLDCPPLPSGGAAGTKTRPRRPARRVTSALSDHGRHHQNRGGIRS